MPVSAPPDFDDPASPGTEAAPRQQPCAATPRLRESDLELIQRTLKACNGNVSDAAERLGVSRGLIYRRLRAAGLPRNVPGA
ncbi:MAG: helix-turn-helix domain-containing protein [Piscinibacter sp.]|nr:helix-turn-helix domain-containing protein [Piscinibacter sp.]